MNEIKQINDDVHKKQQKYDQMFRYIHQLFVWHICQMVINQQKNKVFFFINDNLSNFTKLNLDVSF
jgi:hypothetical protein